MGSDGWNRSRFILEQTLSCSIEKEWNGISMHVEHTYLISMSWPVSSVLDCLLTQEYCTGQTEMLKDLANEIERPQLKYSVHIQSYRPQQLSYSVAG